MKHIALSHHSLSHHLASGLEAFLGVVGRIRRVGFSPLTSPAVPSDPSRFMSVGKEIERKGGVLNGRCSCNFLARSLLVLPNSVPLHPSPSATAGIWTLLAAPEMLEITSSQPAAFDIPSSAPFGLIEFLSFKRLSPYLKISDTPQPLARFRHSWHSLQTCELLCCLLQS